MVDQAGRAKLEDRVTQLQKQVMLLRGWCVVATAGLLGGAVLGSAGPQKDPDGIVRVRGIIVEDEQGRERILIGAPVPSANHRIRTDMAKATAAWGQRYPNMDWYKNVDHRCNGMIILDEQGHDRVAVGAPAPDPNTGKRIGPSYGFAVNDEDGVERSGWGYIPNHSVGLGLDHRSGEGLNIFLLKDGTNGILVRDEGGAKRTFLGHAAPNSVVTGSKEPFQGLMTADHNAPKIMLNAAASRPALELRDATGTAIGRVPAN